MKIKVLGRKMIKPCNPTPHDLKRYKISIIDETAPPMNVAVILFCSKMHDINLLQESLSKILVKFYPLAGRYVKQDQTVDCNDEGADFVEAQAECGIDEVVKLAADSCHLLQDLLPCDTGAVDRVTDPLLSIQVTKFESEGASIAVSISHRVFDTSSLSTFIAAWAELNNVATVNPMSGEIINQADQSAINPTFDSVSLFPGRNLVLMDYEPSRKRDPTFVTRRILFNKEAIDTLKDKIMNQNDTNNRLVSRVRVVCAFLAMFLTRIDRNNEDEEESRDYVIAQAVDIRGRTIPPIPKHSCGNLVAQAFVDCVGGSNVAKKMEFQDFFNILGDATKKTISDCGEIFGEGDENGWYNVLIDPKAKVIERCTRGGGVNLLWFSDWSKFGFYEVDFGWGRPMWCSVGSPEADNLVILMGNKEGDGIEAYVHLHQKFMDRFEQQDEIKSWVVVDNR